MGCLREILYLKSETETNALSFFALSRTRRKEETNDYRVREIEGQNRWFSLIYLVKSISPRQPVSGWALGGCP